MRQIGFVIGLGLCILGSPRLALGQSLPSDVKSEHWAAASVQKALENKLLSLTNGKFNGEAIVTHTQAVIAVARLAQVLEAGKWKAEASVPVPGKVITTLEQGNWQQRPLTRYTLATVLTKFGNYLANGIPKPEPGSKDLAQSIALPPKAKVTVAKSHPAYEALTYLTSRKMLWPGSPLLNPSDKPVKGAEISQALTELATGLNDRQTSLGHDEDGSTIDASSKKKKKK